jgi:hypothetical protein
MILQWLTQRIDKLYAVDGESVAADVLAVEKEIYDKAWLLFQLPTEYTPSAGHAAMANAITAALKKFDGFTSDAGRIARMEMMHVVEGLRHLVALGSPETFDKVAGPTLVPVTTPKVITSLTAQLQQQDAASAALLATPTPPPAPVTPAPVTPAPVTPAPVTPAPVTPAPVTPAAPQPPQLIDGTNLDSPAPEAQIPTAPTPAPPADPPADPPEDDASDTTEQSPAAGVAPAS